MRNWTPIKTKPGVYHYQTVKGKRYGIRRVYKDDTGKSREFTKSGFRNAQEAQIILARFEETLLTVGPDVLRGKRITVDQYFKHMSERKMALNIWRESTRKNVTSFYTRYIKPVFGDTKLDDVSRSRYQSVLDTLAQRNLAKTTANTINSVMMQIMNSAENENIITKNPLRGLEVNGRRPKAQVLEPEDYQHWLSAAHDVLDKYELAMIYIGSLGERRGELMGLRTSSINFVTDDLGHENASITFDLQRNQEFPNGGPLKNQSSYRTIWVTGDIVDQLHFAILTADNIRQRNGIIIDDIHHPWLWVNENGQALHYTHINRLMSRINRRANISIHPHLLRHFFATEAIANNSPQIDVMHYLGHKNLQMTADYTRPTKGASLNVFSAVDPLNHEG